MRKELREFADRGSHIWLRLSRRTEGDGFVGEPGRIDMWAHRNWRQLIQDFPPSPVEQAQKWNTFYRSLEWGTWTLPLGYRSTLKG